MYVDTETTGLDPRLDMLRIVSINGQAFDVWYNSDEQKARELLEQMKDEPFVAHNAQFDLDFLAEHMGYHHQGPIFDTMVAAQMLNTGRRDENGKTVSASLANVVRMFLGQEVDKTMQKAAWDGLVDDQMLFYAAEDTRILQPLHGVLLTALKRTKLERLFKLEMQLLPVLMYAKRRGIGFDLERAKRVRDMNLKRANSMIKFISNPDLNPRSPQNVAQFFGLENSEVDTLRDYAKKTKSKDARRVMEVRKRLKKASTLEKQLISRVRKDGRIHPSFHQTFTETGRLSSREPNLQNQDHGSDIRGLFVPDEGNRFVISDYSQLELRLAALFSRDENMLTAYGEGRDLHTETQLRIFGKPRNKDEGKTTRTLSKNINFGLVFGGGHNTLIKFAAKSGVEISEKEAKEYRDAFRDAYPTLYKWQQTQGDVRPEFVYTALGRRRYITPGEGYCTRINNIVQGSAADGMKLACVILYREHGIVPNLNVHDEVVVECPSSEATGVLGVVKSTMENAMYRATKQNPKSPVVKIVAEAGIADSWAEK